MVSHVSKVELRKEENALNDFDMGDVIVTHEKVRAVVGLHIRILTGGGALTYKR